MVSRVLFAFIFLFFASRSDSFAQDKEFRIGFTLPLSGPFSEFGAAVQNSLTLVQEENSSLFKNIRFILEDDQYNARNSVSAFQKLKALDHVQMILVWGNEQKYRNRQRLTGYARNCLRKTIVQR